jgi:broad specificity phosphatase PhoE
MDACTVVHLLRHGEVQNPRKVLYGRLPGYLLSDLGRRMAEQVGEHLAGRDITLITSSPLERARQTAAAVADQLALPVGTDDRLIEAGNRFEGLTVGVGDGVLRHPRHWRYLLNPFRPSWGEPYAEVAARMRVAVDAAREASAGHEAVLVSHQMPIWIARLAAEHRRLWHDPRRRECSLASLTSFTFDGAALVSVGYSEPAADLLPGAQRIPGA